MLLISKVYLFSSRRRRQALEAAAARVRSEELREAAGLATAA